MTTIRAGELASRAGVNTETIRYYERRGLLGEPDRTLGGHRTYDEDAVTLLRVIKAAQALDCPIPFAGITRVTRREASA
jgi:MerR family mercuric resistance operon transcriptional regulator